MKLEVFNGNCFLKENTQHKKYESLVGLSMSLIGYTNIPGLV